MQDEVIKWLKKQGYPLEMRVASAMRQTGLWVRQSTHYIDLESSKSREIDVLATEREPYGIAEIHFVIECKASNKPWILFTSPFTLDNFNRLSAFGIFSKDARSALVDHFFSKSLDPSLKWMKKDGRVGYNLTPAFCSGEDASYQAACSVIKASMSLLREPVGGCASLIFAFPVIVIGSPLFECFLDENGDTRVAQIKEGWLFFDDRIPGFWGTCIRIVSEAGLEQLSSEILETKDNLQKLIAPDIEREWKKFNEKLKSRKTGMESVQPHELLDTLK
jgi:hypothetical protein